MSKTLKTKIEELRNEPEAVRLRFIMTSILGSGAALVLAWLFLFLPFQLRSGTPTPSVAATPQGNVAGTASDATPSPGAPLVTPQTVQSFEPLPFSKSNDESPTPSPSSSPLSLPVSTTP